MMEKLLTNLIPSKLNFENALIFLKYVKSLYFSIGEMEIPLPEEKEYAVEISDKENFEEFLDSNSDSFHQSLIFSDFPFTKRGAFAFAALSTEIAKTAPQLEKGKDAKIFSFGKIKNTDWNSRIEDVNNPNKINRILDSLPCNATLNPKIKTQYAVHSDGTNVNCYMRINNWKKYLSIPFSENVWQIPGKRFLAVYSADNGIYEGFHPSIGNLVFAATPHIEYGWISEEVNIKNLRDVAIEFAEFYDEIYGLKNSKQFLDFFVLSSILKHNAFAEVGTKKMYSSEFFANIPYMFLKAEMEIAKNNLQEAHFLLRTISDLSLLTLRAAPFGGRMLSLTKFFNEKENIALREFVFSEGVVEMLRSLEIDLEKSVSNAPFVLKKGKNYSIEKGQIFMNFGTLIALMHASGFFTKYKNAFWNSLRSANAALFLASYKDKLSILEEETIVARGSDLIKIEFTNHKIIIKRAMILENGKAKEIKLHLAKLIEIVDKRSVNERNFIEEIGNYGEVVYEFAGKENMVLVSSKRFY